MRLRNIPGADAAITESVYCIKSPETHKGHWQEIFPSQQPLHIEIGMGKGRFMICLLYTSSPSQKLPICT